MHVAANALRSGRCAQRQRQVCAAWRGGERETKAQAPSPDVPLLKAGATATAVAENYCGGLPGSFHGAGA